VANPVISYDRRKEDEIVIDKRNISMVIYYIDILDHGGLQSRDGDHKTFEMMTST